jgi:hypothetical protein
MATTNKPAEQQPRPTHSPARWNCFIAALATQIFVAVALLGYVEWYIPLAFGVIAGLIALGLYIWFLFEQEFFKNIT